MYRRQKDTSAETGSPITLDLHAFELSPSQAQSMWDCQRVTHTTLTWDSAGGTISIETRLYNCEGITSGRLVWQRVKDAVSDAVWDAR
jgi:hypothetical protein